MQERLECIRLLHGKASHLYLVLSNSTVHLASTFLIHSVSPSLLSPPPAHPVPPPSRSRFGSSRLVSSRMFKRAAKPPKSMSSSTLAWDVKAFVTECFRVFVCIGACTPDPHRYYDTKFFPTLGLALRQLQHLVKNELPPRTFVDIRLCTRETVVVKDIHMPKQVLCIYYWDQEEQTFLVRDRPQGCSEGSIPVDRVAIPKSVPCRADRAPRALPNEQRGTKRKNSETQTSPEPGHNVD